MATNTKKDFLTRVSKDFQPWREAAASHPACSDCNCPAPDSDAILEALTGIFAGTLQTAQDAPVTCSSIAWIDYPTRESDMPCGRTAEQVCVSCGDGVCVRHVLNCYQCGQPLHDDCRDDHRVETDHNVDNREPMDPPGWEGGFADNH